jgi:Glycoside hydrolase family 44
MRTASIVTLILLGAGAIVAVAAMPPEQLGDVLVRVKRHTPEIARQAWRARRSRPAATAPTAAVVEEEQAGNPVRSGNLVLECRADARPISPFIYGIGGAGDSPWALGPTARRWGGNPTTRYNWQLNYSNLAKDWFFKNVGDSSGTPTWESFLNENHEHGVTSVITVPTIGWVAKDNTSWGFPASIFGQQQMMAPDNPEAGNGIGRDNKELAPGPPTQTSSRSTPEIIEQWVRKIRQGDGTRGRRVSGYILDNEPSLWNSTHRDVHPDPATYDELLEKTISYATAIRRADPEAKIAGPAEWGWLAYQYSAKDVAAGVQLRPDRRFHNDEPLIPWYLRRIADYEARNKVKLLDIVDVHFYPMAPGIGIAKDGKTDSATAALRIRSTRSLWDASYVDESWINERMRVIPLLKEWIAQNHPGLGVSIGEWNFGAETHMSGGLATAEALGRFGTEGLTSAYYWTHPADRSAAFWAFRAFRNFDEAGGRFLDWTVNARSDAPLSSLFGSRDADGTHVVAVLLNFATLSSLASKVALQGCGTVSAARAFTYTGGEAGFKKFDVSSTPDSLQATFPAYSITVLDLTMNRPPR